MAATKKQTNRKGTGRSSSGRKNTKKKTTAKQSVTSGFQTEIILLIILAASIILIFSNLGMGGTVGATISAAFFGVMGILAYLFPILIFGCAVFLVSNRRNPLAYKKALAALLFCIFLCGLIQLLMEGYMPSMTLADYYSVSSLSYRWRCDRRSNLYFDYLCIWSGRWLCDHCSGIVDFSDSCNTEIFLRICVPCVGCCLCTCT